MRSPPTPQKPPCPYHIFLKKEMIFTSFKKLPNGRSDTSNKSKFPVLYLLVVPVVGKPLHDEVVDTVERRLLVRGVLYRHGDKSDVWIGGFYHILGSTVLGYSVVGSIGRTHIPKHKYGLYKNKKYALCIILCKNIFNFNVVTLFYL